MRQPRLQNGEQIIYEAKPSGWLLSGRYFWTFGLYAIWRNQTRFIVTTQRVIQTKGIVSRTIKSVPIDMVQDAELQTSLGMGSVRLSSAGGPLSIESLGPLRSSVAAELSDVILRQREAARRE
jgi:membrane protein YdbS with pleckstrin-like domain